MKFVRVARGRRGRVGKAGQMPRHQWSHDGRRIRFEMEPGTWGNWSEALALDKTE